MDVFGFSCFFEFDGFDVGDVDNADVEDKNTDANIENTTNNDLLGFENASELSDMEDIHENEDSPPEELDVLVSFDLNKFGLTRFFVAQINMLRNWILHHNKISVLCFAF